MAHIHTYIHLDTHTCRHTYRHACRHTYMPCIHRSIHTHNTHAMIAYIEAFTHTTNMLARHTYIQTWMQACVHAMHVDRHADMYVCIHDRYACMYCLHAWHVNDCMYVWMHAVWFPLFQIYFYEIVEIANSWGFQEKKNSGIFQKFSPYFLNLKEIKEFLLS